MTIHRPVSFYKLSPQINPQPSSDFKLSSADLDTIAAARENPAYKALFEPGLFGIPVLRHVRIAVDPESTGLNEPQPNHSQS